MAAPALSIGFIGFGEVGQALAADFRAAGAEDLRAFDLKFADEAGQAVQAAGRLRVERVGRAADVGDVDVLISAVTAASTVEAAEAAAKGLRRGGFFLDMNSASPRSKGRAAAFIEAVGGRYVEAAVMSPIHPNGARTAMLLGGPHGDAFLERAAPLGLTGAVCFSRDLGKAAAVKMCRSIVVKGLEALLTEALLAARHYDVVDPVLASLSDLLPVPDWPRLARYMISRSIEHGIRRSEEMLESALTVSEADVDPIATTAVAERQRATAGPLDPLGEADLASFLTALARQTERS